MCYIYLFSLTTNSIEYWFRCMDLDGDGVLSLFEMVYFYEEVLQRLVELDIDCLSVENTVCQILDMVNPKDNGEGGSRETVKGSFIFRDVTQGVWFECVRLLLVIVYMVL